MLNTYDESKSFREGKITYIGKMAQINRDGENIPFLAVKIHSVLSVGMGDTIEEDTNVCLLGKDVLDAWCASPSPVIGDTMRVSFATSYVKDSTLCMRVTDPAQLKIIVAVKPQAVPNSAVSHGVPTVDAKEYFGLK